MLMLKFVLLLQFNVHAKKVSDVKETTKTWNIKPPVQPGKKETSNVGERHWAEFYITVCVLLKQLLLQCKWFYITSFILIDKNGHKKRALYL